MGANPNNKLSGGSFHQKDKMANKKSHARGQSMLETALFFMILLIMVTGVIEVAVAVNVYLTIIQGAREGARSAVSTTPDLINCTNSSTADTLAAQISTAAQTAISGSLSLSSSNATIIVTRVRTNATSNSVTIQCYTAYTDPALGSDSSRFTQGEIQTRLSQPSSFVPGDDELVFVEIIYQHQFFLVPANIPMYSYTAMRVVGN